MDSQPRLIGTTTLAVLLVAAPLFDTVESLLSPLTGSTTYADLGAVSAGEGRFVLSVLIGALGTLCYLPALLGLLSRTVVRAPVASRVAALLAVVGLPCFMAIRMGSAVELQGLRDGIGRHTTASLLDHLESNPIAGPMMIVFLAGTLLGMLAVAVAVWRAGLPRPAAVLIALFPVADMALEGLGRSGGVFAHGLVLVGLSWLALVLVRRPSTVAARSAVPTPA